MNEKVLQYLNEEIKNSEKELDDMIDERGLPEDSSFKDIGRDSDGIPLSDGNSDDVYNDGIRYGTREGYSNALIKIKEYVESL